MAEGTIMVLGVDLGCDRCKKKIKKLLCKFHEIRDQTFIEKEDTVIIKVVCCSPDKIRDKLIRKGGKTIKSIEIRVPEKAKPSKDKPKTEEKPAAAAAAAAAPESTPVRGYPPFPYPIGMCCKSCYEGRGGGPCHHGYWIPRQPPSYEGYVRLVPSYDGWASGCLCNRSYGCRCEFSIEENPTCTIM